MSYPARQDPSETVWTRFPQDPRSSGDLRAGDRERDITRDLLSEAYAQGQLNHTEYSERLDAALQAQHLGQLVPLLSDIHLQPLTDLPPAVPAPQPPATPATSSLLGGLAMPPSGVTRTALFVVGVTNLVWVWTSISSGSLQYYWPMWPALGMLIMVLSTMVFGNPEKQREKQLRREQERRELE